MRRSADDASETIPVIHRINDRIQYSFHWGAAGTSAVEIRGQVILLCGLWGWLSALHRRVTLRRAGLLSAEYAGDALLFCDGKDAIFRRQPDGFLLAGGPVNLRCSSID